MEKVFITKGGNKKTSKSRMKHKERHQMYFCNLTNIGVNSY